MTYNCACIAGLIGQAIAVGFLMMKNFVLIDRLQAEYKCSDSVIDVTE